MSERLGRIRFPPGQTHEARDGLAARAARVEVARPILAHRALHRALREGGERVLVRALHASRVYRNLLSRMSDHADSTHAADITLARACAEGDRAALGELERRISRDLAGALSRVGLTRAEIDEVGQIVRERLLVARPDRPAKILEYSGRGPLVGWLRAVIVRAGIDLRRQRRSNEISDDEPLLAATAATDDPTIEALRVRYADAFRIAFVDAVRALDADERNALRLNVVDGLNIEQIGTVFGIHRATVARWIAHARETIADETRRLLKERLGLREAEVESLVRLCRSRIDVGPSLFVDDERGQG
jgi:RNA polymerase sigma-70 factor, ECF subfamily